MLDNVVAELEELVELVVGAWQAALGVDVVVVVVMVMVVVVVVH